MGLVFKCAWTIGNTVVQVKSYFSKVVRSVCMQELSSSNEVGSDLSSHNSHPLRRPKGSHSGRDKDIMNVYDPQRFERERSESFRPEL